MDQQHQQQQQQERVGDNISSSGDDTRNNDTSREDSSNSEDLVEETAFFRSPFSSSVMNEEDEEELVFSPQEDEDDDDDEGGEVQGGDFLLSPDNNETTDAPADEIATGAASSSSSAAWKEPRVSLTNSERSGRSLLVGENLVSSSMRNSNHSHLQMMDDSDGQLQHAYDEHHEDEAAQNEEQQQQPQQQQPQQLQPRHEDLATITSVNGRETPVDDDMEQLTNASTPPSAISQRTPPQLSPPPLLSADGAPFSSRSARSAGPTTTGGPGSSSYSHHHHHHHRPPRAPHTTSSPGIMTTVSAGSLPRYSTGNTALPSRQHSPYQQQHQQQQQQQQQRSPPLSSASVRFNHRRAGGCGGGHARINSESSMSALTDNFGSSPGGVLLPRSHGRNISWDSAVRLLSARHYYDEEEFHTTSNEGEGTTLEEEDEASDEMDRLPFTLQQPILDELQANTAGADDDIPAARRSMSKKSKPPKSEHTSVRRTPNLESKKKKSLVAPSSRKNRSPPSDTTNNLKVSPSSDQNQRKRGSGEDRHRKNLQRSLEAMDRVTEYEEEAETRIFEAIDKNRRESAKDKGKVDPFGIPIQAAEVVPNSIASVREEEEQLDGQGRKATKTKQDSSPALDDLAQQLLAVRKATKDQISPQLRSEAPTNGDHPSQNQQAVSDGDSSQSDKVYQAVALMKAASEKKRKKPTVKKSAIAIRRSDQPEPLLRSPVVNDGDIETGLGGERSPFFATTSAIMRSIKADWDMFEEFVRPKRRHLLVQLGLVIVLVIIPCLGIAAILFYLCGNPPTGQCSQKDDALCGLNNDGQQVASTSWWVLFIGVRQVLTLMLARVSEAFLVQYLACSSPSFVRIVGPRISMFLSLSKGWPCILTFWALYDIILLYGGHDFSNHWLFWQDYILLFSSTNPAGRVTDARAYGGVLGAALVLGVATSLKRVYVSWHIASRQYDRFHSKLADITQQALLISKISMLTLKGEPHSQVDCRLLSASRTEDALFSSMGSGSPPESSGQRPGFSASRYDSSRTFELDDMWEEPDNLKTKADFSVRDIFEFRQAYHLMIAEQPFSSAFGPAGTRKQCAESATRVFRRLLDESDKDGNDTLSFSRLVSEVAYDEKTGRLSKTESSRLFETLRPDKNGNITLLDFVKSVDAVYRSIRTITSSVDNACQIDRSFESVANWLYYLIIGSVCLAIIGLDPLSVIISFSTILVGFAFMIGSASAQWFEGILFVLARKPFDIGDRISIGEVAVPSQENGEKQWIIEKVDMFTTTARFVHSREVATFSNGSLARKRIINMNRSENAQVTIHLKFGIDVSWEKIKTFYEVLRNFIEDRPQEWLLLQSFRSIGLEEQSNYIEYVLTLHHRKSWQNWLAVMKSKSSVTQFCMELRNQLDIRYHTPPMPVHLSVDQGYPSTIEEGTGGVDSNSGDNGSRRSSDSDNLTDDMASLRRMFATTSGEA